VKYKLNFIVKWLIIRKLKELIKKIEKQGGIMKPGWLTSEFVIGLIGTVVISSCKALGLPEEASKQLLSLVLAFIGSRTVIKIFATKIIREGFRTTEFYATLITGIITYVGQFLKLDPQIIDLITKLALVIIGSRTVVKVSNAIKTGTDVGLKSKNK